MRELSELKNSPPEGIRVITSDDNMLDVTGIIEGPEGTPYAGGYFRVKFKFTEEFPAAPPKCWFATKIFHPNVSTAGEICVNTLKKDWKSTYGIGHILITVKCLLIYPNPESALDEEAGRLLLENYDSYCERAKLITSVHATPRERPVEFSAPASSSVATASTSKTMSSVPIHPSAASALPTPMFTIPLAVPTSSRKSPSPSQPLQASPSNTRPLPTSTSTTSLSVDKDSKERHTSPSPLGIADSNVEGKVGASTMGAQTVQASTKAVKRAAGAGTGAEKRKKALKRL